MAGESVPNESFSIHSNREGLVALPVQLSSHRYIDVHRVEKPSRTWILSVVSNDHVPDLLKMV